MTTLTTPHDLLAAIPFLIGYHPIDSLVLVSIKDESVGMAMRIDYPVREDEYFFDAMVAHCSAEGADGALIVAYQPLDQSDGDRVLAQVTAALSRAGIAIYESILIAQGYFRSLLCHDITCCPVEGRPVPPLHSSRIAAESVVAGHPMPFATFATFAELNDSVRANLLADEAPWLDRVKKSCVDPHCSGLNEYQRDGATAVIDLANDFLVNGISSDQDLIAHVIGRLSDIQVRDFALGSHDSESIDAYRTMWLHLLRSAPTGFIAPVATLAAAVAYESGDGALARAALARAFDDTPTYSLATLLQRVFSAGWPPQSFVGMRSELHPKVTAAIFGS
jgi:hypothetical protein